MWQILQYSEARCYLNTRGFPFTVNGGYIKTQTIVIPARIFWIPYLFVQFGLYSPTSTAYIHKHKRAKNGRGFMIQWLELSSFQFLTVARIRDGHLRTRNTGSCQQIWCGFRLDSEWHWANYAKYSTYVHTSSPCSGVALKMATSGSSAKIFMRVFLR